MSTYVPAQHGAWAFLGLPVLLGAQIAWSPLVLLLATAWVAAYCWSAAAFGLVRARRPQRFRRPFAVWLGVTAPLAAVLVVERPWLVVVGLGYLVLFGVNLAYARRNRERALVNDLVFVLECAAMVWVTWGVGAGTRTWSLPRVGRDGKDLIVLSLVCGLVLAGSTLHVKSLLRERRNPAYSTAAKALAVASVGLGLALSVAWGWPHGLWLAAPFVALAVRAFLLPGRSLRPGAIGIVELGCYLLVPITVALA